MRLLRGGKDEQQVEGQTTVGEAIAADEATGSDGALFEAGAQPQGVIEFPEGMSEDDRERFVEEFKARHGLSGPEAFKALKAAAEGAKVEGPTVEDLAKKLEAGGELSDEEAAQLAAASMEQVPVPMMTIPLQNCQLRIVPNDEGGKNIFVGPIAVTFVLPLAELGVQNVVRDLSGSNLVVASAMPAGAVDLSKVRS